MLQILTNRKPLTFRKLPKKILIIAHKYSFKPSIDAEVDYIPKNKDYDLFIYIDKVFRLNIDIPFCIANSEIWFERGYELTEEIFTRALVHYSSCEIRNGK